MTTPASRLARIDIAASELTGTFLGVTTGSMAPGTARLLGVDCTVGEFLLLAALVWFTVFFEAAVLWRLGVLA